MRVLGVPVRGPMPSSRARPDGQRVEWEYAFLGEGEPGATLPFIIADHTPRALRMRPSTSVAGTELTGVELVVLAVPDLVQAAGLFRRVYEWPALTLYKDLAFGATLAPHWRTSPARPSSWPRTSPPRISPTAHPGIHPTPHHRTNRSAGLRDVSRASVPRLAPSCSARWIWLPQRRACRWWRAAPGSGARSPGSNPPACSACASASSPSLNPLSVRSARRAPCPAAREQAQGSPRGHQGSTWRLASRTRLRSLATYARSITR